MPLGELTHAPGAGRIEAMRKASTFIALVVICAGFLVPAAVAQQDKVWKDPEPEAEPYVPPPAWKSVEVGDFYLRRKKYRAALSRYKEATKIDPYYAPAYLGLGKVYDKIGLKEKALEDYHKYLDLLPSTKQAEEATDVHKAIARLERKLKKSKRSRTTSTPPRDAASSSSPD
jgi:tetratricopeptide (TPR) repeat protein